MSRVLLIEPDFVLAEIYTKALGAAGHEVMLACDAQGAVDAADRQTPDVAVLEIQLAAHNGLEFLYEFRSYIDWQNVPVIIHSLVPPAQLTRHAKAMTDLNVASYLYKPQTSLDKLLRSVDLTIHSLTINN